MRRLLFLLFVSFSAVAQAHPLVGAAGRGDLAAVRCMIESGVCTEVRNGVGETALMAAVDKGHAPVVQYLLANGANVNACDDHGENTFHEAIEEGRQPILEMLIKDPRLDINAPDTYGRTPLMRFAEAGKTDWVARLLAMGATVGDTDRWGRTALDRTSDATIQRLLKARGGM